MLTKLLSELILNQHRATIMGWGGKGNAERSVKIFILVAVSNVMNLLEIFQYQVYAGLYYQAHKQGHIQPVWAYYNQARPE